MAQIIHSLRRNLTTTGAAGTALLVLLVGVLTNRYRVEGLPLRPQPEHFALGIGLLALGYLFFKRRLRPGVQWSDALLVLYLALALAVSFLFPADPRASAQYWTRMGSSVAVYFFARWLIGSTDSSAAVKLLLKAFLIWGVLEGLLGIFAWLLYPFGINLGVDEYPLGVRGPGGILCNFSLTTYGTLWEPNVFGGLMMLTVLIAAVLFVSNDFTVWRKHLGVGMIVMLVALALNASRGALGTLGLGLVFILFFVGGMSFREKIKWFAAAVLLVAVVSVPSVELSRVMMQMPTAPGLAQRAPCAKWIAEGMQRGTLPGDPEFDPATGPEVGSGAMKRFLEGQTLSSRWVSYQKAWERFLERPLLGNGANSFGQIYTTTAHTPGWISNLLLMSLHDTGLIGTLILMAWFAWFAGMVWRSLRGASFSRARTQGVALVVGLAALLITYQVTTMLWFGLVWLLFAVTEASMMLQGVGIERKANSKLD